MSQSSEQYLAQCEPMTEEQYLQQFNPDDMDNKSLVESISMNILPTKGNVESIAQHIANSVIDDGADPFETIAKIEAIKAVCEEARKKLDAHVRSELEKYGKEGIKKLDAKFELAEVGVKYDYSGDPVWSRIAQQITPLQEAMKEREKRLKTVTKTMIETDPETGETFEVPPPVKNSKSSFKVTLGK